MNKFISIVVSCLMLIGCATAGTDSAKSADANKQEKINAQIKSLIARESAGLKPVQAGGALKITVLSKGAPKSQRIKGSEKVQYQLDIPIGASQNVDCYLTEGMSSPSVILKTVYDGIVQVPQIASVAIKTVNADIVKNIGYIYLEAEYLTKEKLYGTAKIFAASSMNMSFYCTHDELGYKKTFMSVAESVAKSDYAQKFLKDFSGYDKKQIDIVSVNTMRVGYAESYQFTDDGKKERKIGFSSFLLPRSTKEFMTIDSIEKSVYAKGTGNLLSGDYYSYENNEEQHEIEFEQVSPKNYQARGSAKGQKFSQSFKTEKPLVYSGFLVDQYGAGKIMRKELDFEEYLPLSPSKPVKSRIVLKGKTADGNKQIEYSFHSAKASIELDEKSYTQMNVDMGGVSLLIKRRYFDAR